MVKFVISPEFFGINESRNKIKEQLGKWGVGEISFTEDNFVIALMNETQFENFIIKLKERIELYISDTVKKYNINSIEHDNEYINFTVFLDTINNDMKNIACELNMSAAIYQIFNGIPQDEATIIVKFKKTSTGELINIIDTSKLIGGKI